MHVVVVGGDADKETRFRRVLSSTTVRVSFHFKARQSRPKQNFNEDERQRRREDSVGAGHGVEIVSVDFEKSDDVSKRHGR